MAHAAHFSRDSETLSISKFHSKGAPCLCQQMPQNSLATIAGSRRLYHKACIRLSKCACGKTDGDAASRVTGLWPSPQRSNVTAYDSAVPPYISKNLKGRSVMTERKNTNRWPNVFAGHNNLQRRMNEIE